jgi:hypothetical protein
LLDGILLALGRITRGRDQLAGSSVFSDGA